MLEFIDDDLRGARFRRVDLSGSRWHGVMLQNVKITDTWVNNVEISGLIGTLKVNDVDVSAFVRAELDKRHPERRMLSATDVEGLRAAWAMIAENTRATVERARALPEALLDESVDDEFSFIQTLRHLVFATDRWITGPVLADPKHFHPLGYPHDGADDKEVAALDVDARPSLDEVLEVRRERMKRVAELLRASSHDDLRRTVPSPNGGTTSVMSCIHVVLGEEWEHNRYANRDLDVLSHR
jgi:hypothetical protein